MIDESLVETESADCALCGSARHKPFLAADNVRRGTRRVFAVVECLNCGFRFTNPRPTRGSMTLYYPDHYESLRPEAPSRAEQVYYRLFRRVPARRPGALLDVGCGSGKFLYLMRRRGWRCTGQDISRVPAYVERDFQLHRREMHECDLPAGSFDAVTMWWSIEHLRRPLEDLKQCRRILRSGGSLSIATSNSDSIEAALFKRYWHHLAVPEHYSQFTARTLALMVEKAGFKVLSLRHDPLSLGFANSLRHCLKSRGVAWRAYPALDALCVPLDAAAALCGRSALITLHAV